jgi:serine/threonine protein kinase
VYAIGCLLYEMLTGRPPFRAGDEMVLALQHLRQEPPSLQVLVPHAPPALAQIVHKALAKEPSARYRNAGQLAQILRSQLGFQPPSLQPEALPPPAFPVRQRLVVPPPPTPSPADVWSSREMYSFEDDEGGLEYPSDWSEGQPGKVDWIMIGLVIAALIAVLGLIPLWRTVYQRYAAPPPDSAQGSYFQLEGDPCLAPLGIDGLRDWGTGMVDVYRYRPARFRAVGLSPARVPSPNRRSDPWAKEKIPAFGSPAYGFRQQSVIDCMGNV